MKAIFAMMLYSLEKHDPKPSYKDGHHVWRFRMYPRKWAIFLMTVLFSPILILIGGIKQIKETYKHSVKVQSWSSYEIHKPIGQKPSRMEYFRKF